MARGRSSAPVTPVGPGKTAAPAAAAKSPAATSNRTPAVNRSPVPPENPAVAARPVADPLPPPPSRDGGEGGGGPRAEDSSESDNEAILSPDSINASRRDAEKARHRLRAQLEDGLEGYDKSGVSFKLYDICKHKHFLRISVLQVSELFLCAG